MREAGPEIHADQFTQARWLLKAGFVIGAATTAQAELDRRLRDAMRARGHSVEALVDDSTRGLLTAALCAGIIEPSTGRMIESLECRFSQFMHGRRTDPCELLACLEELHPVAASLVGVGGD